MGGVEQIEKPLHVPLAPLPVVEQQGNNRQQTPPLQLVGKGCKADESQQTADDPAGLVLCTVDHHGDKHADKTVINAVISVGE